DGDGRGGLAGDARGRVGGRERVGGRASRVDGERAAGGDVLAVQRGAAGVGDLPGELDGFPVNHGGLVGGERDGGAVGLADGQRFAGDLHAERVDGFEEVLAGLGDANLGAAAAEG